MARQAKELAEHDARGVLDGEALQREADQVVVRRPEPTAHAPASRVATPTRWQTVAAGTCTLLHPRLQARQQSRCPRSPGTSSRRTRRAPRNAAPCEHRAAVRAQVSTSRPGLEIESESRQRLPEERAAAERRPTVDELPRVRAVVGRPRTHPGRSSAPEELETVRRERDIVVEEQEQLARAARAPSL